jgi:MFS family permease
MSLPPGEGERSFRALVGAQFFGAFNDNLFKQLIALLAAATLFPGEDKQGVAFAVFALPFVLFSGIAGDLSEKFSKRSIIWRMKVAEIVIMLGAIWALQAASWGLMLAVLFVMGSQSAIFGPSKYGVIPELVRPNRLVAANSTIAMTTFLAALFGGALAGPLLDYFGPAAESPRMWLPGIFCVGFAVIGTVFARYMHRVPPLQPDLVLPRQPFGNLPATIGRLRREKGLFRLVLLYSLFWFDSAVINQAINAMGRPGYLELPPGNKTKLSILLALISVGIITGSLLARFLARRFPLSTLVLGGGTLMVGCQAALLAIGTVFVGGDVAYYYAAVVLVITGVAGAVFVVPLQSYLQDGPAPGMRGQTFAVNNFMNFLFMFLGGVFWIFAGDGLGPALGQIVGGSLMLAFLWANRAAVRSMRIGDSD